jgi:NAD(P)-dependent dehydrogenase (short-subunit alcohol dehydrogenase family)
MGMLDGKVTVIAGATSGIGAAIADIFVAEGSKVIVAGRRTAVGETLAARLGASCHFVRTDIASEDQVRTMIEAAGSHFGGGLDCLVNNAGYAGPFGPIADLDMAEYDQAMNVLLRGVVVAIKHAAPIMIAKGRGSIINIASIAGSRTGYAGHTYSAAKAAVIHLTRSLAMELGPMNIRVNSISPGGILTGIFGKAFGVDDETADNNVHVLEDIFSTFQPVPRPGRPEDIARAAVFLASDGSAFVNGHELMVDGGVTNGMTQAASNEIWEQIAGKFAGTAAKVGD